MITAKPRRVSNLITVICIPIAFILCIQVSVLTRNLRAVSISDSGILDSLDSEYTGSKNEVSANISASATQEKSKAFDRTLSNVGYPLNNTVRAREDLLIYTPILRCGASSLKYLLKTLKEDNSFAIFSPPPKEAEIIHIPKRDRQASTAAKVSSVNETAVIIDSFAFINFTEFGFQQPIQISVVRDPLERAISWYYFMRAPYQIVERHNLFPEVGLPSRNSLRKSLEICLEDKKDPECNYEMNEVRFGHTIEFFCGHEQYCKLFGNSVGLQRAKFVVEKNFAVVGVLEEWEKTVIVLENYIPRFFTGAYNLAFGNSSGRNTLLGKNIYKPSVDNWAKEKLRRQLAVEYEFYEYLRQRLNNQYDALYNS